MKLKMCLFFFLFSCFHTTFLLASGSKLCAELAAQFGKVDVIEGMSKEELESINEYGETPLYWAANMGNSECVKVLLEKGVDPTLADEDGKTPLECAKDPKFEAFSSVDCNALYKELEESESKKAAYRRCIELLEAAVAGWSGE